MNAEKSWNLKETVRRAPHLSNGFFQVNKYSTQDLEICTPSKPSKCTTGITLSVWSIFDKPPTGFTPDAAVTIVNSGPPVNMGLGIYLTANSGAKTGKITATWIIDDGKVFWRASADLLIDDVVGSWHNWAISWAQTQGVFGILDGRIIGFLLSIFT